MRLSPPRLGGITVVRASCGGAALNPGGSWQLSLTPTETGGSTLGGGGGAGAAAAAVAAEAAEAEYDALVLAVHDPSLAAATAPPLERSRPAFHRRQGPIGAEGRGQRVGNPWGRGQRAEGRGALGSRGSGRASASRG